MNYEDYTECLPEELKARIQKAGYKLGGQINTIDNGKINATELALKCELLVNQVDRKIKRVEIKELQDLMQEIRNIKERLVYTYSRAIEQNSNVRSILEKGEDNDR